MEGEIVPARPSEESFKCYDPMLMLMLNAATDSLPLAEVSGCVP